MSDHSLLIICSINLFLTQDWNRPPHHHGSGDMRSANRDFREVAVAGCCVDEPLFLSALLLTFVYAIMILMYENTHNMNIRGE